jgi:hypothetical protein
MRLIYWDIPLGQDGIELLPFEEPCMPQQTRLIRSSLSFEDTQALLQVKASSSHTDDIYEHIH